MRRDEGQQFGSQIHVPGARRIDVLRPRRTREAHSLLEELPEAVPVRGAHPQAPATSSRWSHACATAQSRFTVVGEMPSAVAVSGIDMPP